MNIQNYKIFEIENTEGIEQYLELKQNGLPVIPKIELERSEIGPKAKQDMGKLLQMFSETDPETIINELNSKGFIYISNRAKLDSFRQGRFHS